MTGKMIEFGNVKAESGELRFGSLKAAELPDGAQVNFPLMILNGKMEGPVLTVTSAIHGQEITGIEVIRRLLRERVHAENLKGGVVAIPIGNPLAYYHSARVTPYDSGNLAASFPGRTSGSTTARMANVLWQVIKEADCYIDLHCVPLALPYTIVNQYSASEMQSIATKNLELAKAFDFPIIVSREKDRDSRAGATALANREGIPAFVAELPDWKTWTDVNAERGVRGILNVMKALGMINGRVEEQSDLPYPRGPFFRILINSNRGGIVHPTKQLGAKVSKGDELARILTPYGDIVETISAPVDGYVGTYCFMENQAVPSGELVIFLWHSDENFYV